MGTGNYVHTYVSALVLRSAAVAARVARVAAAGNTYSYSSIHTLYPNARSIPILISTPISTPIPV